MSADSNVVSIYPGEIADPRVASEQVVATLEKALERARSGEMIGVVILWTDFDTTSNYTDGGDTASYSMLGVAYKAAHYLAEKA